MLALYRELLSLRRRHPALLDTSRDSVRAEALSRPLLVFRRGVGTGNELLAVANLSPTPQVLDPLPAPLDSSCRLLLSTEEERFGGSGAARPGEQANTPWNLAAFELVLFERYAAPI